CSCLRAGVIPAPSELLPPPLAEHDNTRRVDRLLPTRGKDNARRVYLLSLSSRLRRRATPDASIYSLLSRLRRRATPDASICSLIPPAAEGNTRRVDL